jgi:hypothetical protein
MLAFAASRKMRCSGQPSGKEDSRVIRETGRCPALGQSRRFGRPSRCLLFLDSDQKRARRDVSFVPERRFGWLSDNVVGAG